MPPEDPRASAAPFAGGAAPTHVVPLGISCRVTYQARSFFGSSARFPFDWWVSSLDGLARYLRSPDPDRIFGPGALEERLDGGGIRAIASRAFGFELFHAFPRRTATTPQRVVSPHWRDHVPEARARHAAALERLLDLDRPDARVLCVRDRLGPGDDPGRAGDLVGELWGALLALWPRAQVALALVNLPPGEPPDPRVRHVAFDDPPGPPPESWRGDGRRWAAAFAALGFEPPAGARPAAPEPSPGEETGDAGP